MSSSDYFKNQRVLYFDYSTAYALQIKQSIVKQGGIVDYFSLINISFKSKVYRNTNKNLYLNNKLIYLHNILKKIKSIKYDYILINAPYEAPISFIEELANIYPNVPKISYICNSILVSDYHRYISLFDRMISFEPKDCREFNLEYYPLFFIDEYKQARKVIREHPKDIDVVIVGSAYTKGRYPFLKRINEYCNNHGLKCYYYLQSSRLLFYKNLLRGIYIPGVEYKYLSHSAIIDLFKRAKVVIDSQMEGQTGITIRTFEALGAGMKLITNNNNILSQEFYSPEHVHVLNDDASFDVDFVNNYIVAPNPAIEKYHIDYWVRKVLIG